MRLTAMLAVICLLFALLGCATTTTTTTDTDGNTVTSQKTVDKEKSLALARIIARRAGKYVAVNNPAVAASVTAAYATIKDFDGDVFRQAFLDKLQAYLDAKGIDGSAELRADAADILDLFGFDLSETTIDLAFLQQFEVESVKTVVAAFIEGMALAA